MMEASMNDLSTAFIRSLLKNIFLVCKKLLTLLCSLAKLGLMYLLQVVEFHS